MFKFIFIFKVLCIDNIILKKKINVLGNIVKYFKRIVIYGIFFSVDKVCFFDLDFFIIILNYSLLNLSIL